MVVISHAAPTDWIRLPSDETSVAHQNNAKTRCANGATVALRQRANAVGSILSSVTWFLRDATGLRTPAAMPSNAAR